MSASRKSSGNKNEAWLGQLARRPGSTLSAEIEPVNTSMLPSGISLSEILWYDPKELQDNPLNEYPPLDGEDFEDLVVSVRELGILQAMLIKTTNSRPVLIYGHNRKRAALEAKLDKVPVQIARGPLTDEIELKLMRAENDNRRGGGWSRDKKVKFIVENYGRKVLTAHHGGSRDQDSINLASEVAEKSRGKITVGTAKRLIAELRKKTVKAPPVSKPKAPLPSNVLKIETGLRNLLTAVRGAEKAKLKKRLMSLIREL